MPNVLITGANRGIGLEFARQYAEAGWTVYATARDPGTADDLRALPGAVTVLPFDAGDDASIEALAAALADTPLDLIIPNAGVGGTIQPASDVTFAEWSAVIGINTFAPFRLAVALRANLERGEGKTLAGISSLAASLGSGYSVQGQYVYRASKAALNALWRNLSVEWRPLGITCLVLRPGRVRTRMTEFSGDLSVEDSVSGMRRVIDSAGPEQSGRFFGYDGREVAW